MKLEHSLTFPLLLVMVVSTVGVPAMAQNRPDARADSTTSRCQNPTNNSPTGRNPRILWTCDTQGLLSRAWAEYKKSPDFPRSHAASLMKLETTFAHTGVTDAMASAVVYQASGDIAYAQDAYNVAVAILKGGCCPNSNDNFYREALLRFCVLYEWILPGISDQQRGVFLALLKGTMRDALHLSESPTPRWVRLEDSDQVMGFYFGIWALHHITNGTDPEVEAAWNDPRMGGLEATGENTTSTVRNAIRYYIHTMSAGGEYIESSEYNPGTSLIFLLGYKAMLVAYAHDYLPEIAEFADDYALRFIYMITPGLEDSYQWGDDERPGQIRIGYSWSWPLSEILAVIKGTPNAAAAQDFFLRLAERYRYGQNVDLQVSAASYGLAMGYDPYQPRSNFQTLPPCKAMPGQGFVFCHRGWTKNDSFFGGQIQNSQMFVDHQPDFFDDFQLHRDGWAVTHPITYAGVSLTGHGANGLTFYDGLYGRAWEFRRQTAQESGDDYAYLAGTTGGSYGQQHVSDVEPTWNHEATVSLVYLPSPTNAIDTVVRFYRFYAKSPLGLCNVEAPGNCFDAYHPQAFRTIFSTKPRRDISLHLVNRPVCFENECTWKTKEGENGVVTTILPLSFEHTVQQETKGLSFCVATSPHSMGCMDYGQHDTASCGDSANYSQVGGGECGRTGKWQIRTRDRDDPDYTTFLDVTQVFKGNVVRAARRVESEQHDAQGVVLQRQGMNDTLVLFNARRGRLLAQPTNGPTGFVTPESNQRYLTCVRLARTGYRVRFEIVTSTADTFLFDLDPSGNWTYSVDDGARQPLRVSSQGLARPTISGVGSHTLATFVTGASECTGGIGDESEGQKSIAIADNPVVAPFIIHPTAKSQTIQFTNTGDFLVVGLIGDISRELDTGCVFGGTPLQRLGGVKQGSDRWTATYTLKQPPTGTFDLTCTFSDLPDVVQIAAISYRGTDPLRQASSAEALRYSATGSSWTQVAIAFRSNSWMVVVGRTVGVAAAGEGTIVRVADTNGLTIMDSGGPATGSGDMYQLHINGNSQWGGLMFPIYPRLAEGRRP